MFVLVNGSGHDRLPATAGYFAVRICDLDARPPSPLNSRSPATMLPGPARGRQRSASELVVRGRAVLLTHNRDAKLAEIRPTAARIAQADGPGRPARFGNICPLRPSALPLANISFRVLAFGAVARIGCVCIAVLSVSGSLELQRRRIKSATYYGKQSEKMY